MDQPDLLTDLTRILPLLVAVTSLIVAILSLIFAIIGYKRSSDAKRVHSFQFAIKIIKNNYTKLAEKSLEIYREIYTDQFDKEQMIINHLIYRKDWTINENQRAIPITEVELISSGNVIERSGTHQKETEVGFDSYKITPYPFYSLVENLLIFSNGVNIWDHPTYAIRNISIQKNEDSWIPRLDVYKCSYYDFFNSCMCFEFVMADTLSKGKKVNDRPMEFKRKYSLEEFSNRDCGIGIVTLTLFKNVITKKSVKNYLVLHTRSKDVIEGSNIINAVPAGTFQPSTSGTEIEPIILNIVREFSEELLGKIEFTYEHDIGEVRSSPIGKILERGTYFLGMGFNPVNSYLELMTITVIDLNDKQSRKIFGRTVFDLEERLSENFEGTYELQTLSKKKLLNLSKTYRAAPSLKEICSLLYDNFDNLPFL